VARLDLPRVRFHSPRANPALIGNPLFAFPGGYLNPAVAVSAGRAMADPWLGESPYWNPAAPVEFLGELSLQGSHIERQDIRANNREVDETFAFFSGGGAAIGAPLTKWLGVWLYASRPEARFEENAFRAGTSTDPSVVPAVIQSRTESRESRGGVGVSTKFGAFRLGAAVEATKRKRRVPVDRGLGGTDRGRTHAVVRGRRDRLAGGRPLGVVAGRGEGPVRGRRCRASADRARSHRQRDRRSRLRFLDHARRRDARSGMGGRSRRWRTASARRFA
jgi:hypothetical protein